MATRTPRGTASSGRMLDELEAYRLLAKRRITTATSVALEADHAVVARSSLDAVAIDAIDLARGAPGSLLRLDGPSSLDVALVLDRDVLYFNDDGPRASDRRPFVAVWFCEFDSEGDLTGATSRFAAFEIGALPNIQFGQNSWRGDHFAEEICPWIIERESEAEMRPGRVA